MIASGKSTYTKSMCESGAISINDDDVVKLVHGGNYLQYQKNLKPLYKAVEISILTHAITLNKDIIVDRGLNISKQGRKRFISLANSFDIPCRAIVFPRSDYKIHAKRRFDADSRGHSLEYWEKVAKHHGNIWEDPTLEEGFVDIFYV